MFRLVSLAIAILPVSTEMAYDLKQLIVWNVGQGQWISGVDGKTCRHFDTGGEFSPARKDLKLCKSRDNRYFFSHWDWDHIGLIYRAKYLVGGGCIAKMPLGTGNLRKKKMLNSFPKCEPDRSRNVQELSFTGQNVNALSHKKKGANYYSRILIYHHEFLITGDSDKEAESEWVRKLASVRKIRVLILGHHGSATSTSDQLLELIPHARMAVASARKNRYGHPHPEVTARLKRYKLPMLRTEDWGNIHFLLN